MYDLDYEEEFKAAEEGDLAAMYNVASYIIWKGQDSPVDTNDAELAVRYYTANAEAGDTDSMLDLGAMYDIGRGVPKNPEKAVEWYEKAASLNGHNACRCLGNHYKYDTADDGMPVPTSDPVRLRKALEWYEKGAERREENSLYELGDYYRHGLFVEKDEEKAYQLYKKAYEIIQEEVLPDGFSNNDSYADVCFCLAECHHYGIGTESDLMKAFDMIQIALKESRQLFFTGDRWAGAVYPEALREWKTIFFGDGR